MDATIRKQIFEFPCLPATQFPPYFQRLAREGDFTVELPQRKLLISRRTDQGAIVSRLKIKSATDRDRAALALRLGGDQEADVNRAFSIFNCLIFDSNVDGGIPSLAAAPRGPATLPLLLARAALIISFS